MRLFFDNTYEKLPEDFYARLTPTPVLKPDLVKLNCQISGRFGLDFNALNTKKGADIFAGNRVPQGAAPISMAYGGHQFGGWAGLLGDGRAVLLGELFDVDGQRFDVQLKGAGRTPFSRTGDGRAWIGPVLREYVLSEALAALGVPTTRALAVVTTGENVMREDMFPGAVLTRIASSHVRVGTFEYFAARQDVGSLRKLADYVINRHYPDASDKENPYLTFLDMVVGRQVDLIAKWMGVGFIHGVMNTDNMSISGETLDYGPCAFMDTYHPQTVYSSIDHMGRYAYQNQPEVAQWNLSRLAMAILPLIDPNEGVAAQTATNAIRAFSDLYNTAWSSLFGAKIGLVKKREGDRKLVEDLLHRMIANKMDFTQTFRRLSHCAAQSPEGSGLRDELAQLGEWMDKWRTRLGYEDGNDAERQKTMCAVNPAYIPRNHRVEQMIEAALKGDFSLFERLNEVLSKPYEDQPQSSKYLSPPQPDEIVHNTYCGT